MPDDTIDRVFVETSFAQQSLWLQHQIDPDQPTYNVTAVVRVRGPLDSDALERALNLVVDRHDVLRSVFELRDGIPMQVILPTAPLTISVRPVCERDVPTAVRLEVAHPFDLRTGPLLRLRLLRLSADEHIALLIMHHIVTDGISSRILFTELATIYEALIAGRSPELPEPPIQYADFAVWQREILRGETLKRLSEYWADALTGAVPVQLPTDRPHHTAASPAGASHRFVLPAELVARLEQLASRHHATLFMLLLTGFAILLTRYSGQRDITVAAPVAGRSQPELEGVLGYFVNPLLLRVKLTDDPTIAELLAQVRQSCVEAFDHQDMPFELVTNLLRRRDQAVPGQVMLTVQNMGRPSWQAAGLAFEPMEADTGTAKTDLSLEIEPGLNAYYARLEYRTDLFDSSTVERLATNLLTVLGAVAEEPELRVSHTPVLSAAERQRQLVEWNPHLPEPELDASQDMLVTRWAQASPNSPAVVHGRERIDYAELDRRAATVAAKLRRHGVRADRTVALVMPIGIDLAVAVAAVSRLGCGLLVVDHTDPPAYLHRQLADSAVDFVVGIKLAVSSAPPVLLRWENLTSGPADDVSPSRNPTMVYWRTDPRAVTVTPGPQMLAGTVSVAAALGLKANSRYRIRATDPQSVVAGLITALAVGAAAILPEPGIPYLAADLANTVELPADNPMLGWPRYVLDNRLQPVPIGAVGELYVGGPAIGIGYRDEPARTAAVFVPDPYGVPGGRLVRTGDLARYRSDGSLVLVGRTDSLVRIDGQLVDPAEVERELAKMPDVECCAVLPHHAETGEVLLTAYVVGKNAYSDIRSLLAERLPARLLPEVIVPLDQMFTTATGAIDKDALAAAGPNRPTMTGYVAPRTPFEEVIARMWAELLGVPEVGIYDDFFELGGQSLIATRLTARIYKEFGVELTIRDLFYDNNFNVAEVAWLVLTRMFEADGATG